MKNYKRLRYLFYFTILISLISWRIEIANSDENERDLYSKDTIYEQTYKNPLDGWAQRFSFNKDEKKDKCFIKAGDKTIETAPEEEDKQVIIQLSEEPITNYKEREKGLNKAQIIDKKEKIRLQHEKLKSDIYRLENEVAGEKKISISKIKRSKIKREYDYAFNGIAATIHKDAIRKIKKLPYVKEVFPDVKMEAFLDKSVPLINADKVWNLFGEGTATGEGIVVAVVDTGIDYNHPDLGGGFGPSYKVIGGYDCFNNDSDPMDDVGHGTHVAGIIAANGTLKGVAPDAKLMAYKVLGSQGGSESDVIAGIEMALNPDGDPATNDAVDVINMSLGGIGTPDDPISQAVDNATLSGVVCVVAAGNSGRKGYQTVGSPGLARKAITVGASDDSDFITDFSSRGPVSISFDIKPDIVAPGYFINSTLPDSRYGEFSGTSMAAPHIAGAVAILRQLYPNWTPEEIKNVLTETAIVNLGMDYFSQGSGRVDLLRAVNTHAMLFPSQINLGFDDFTQSLWQANRTLQIKNISNSPVSYEFFANGKLPLGITCSVSPYKINLAPGQIGTVNVSLSVNNNVVPNVTEPPYGYQGKIIAKSNQGTLNIPFSFIKCPVLNLVYEDEFDGSLIHNRIDWSAFLIRPQPKYSLFVPKIDSYDIFSISLSTTILNEQLQVNPITTLTLSKANAKNHLRFINRDKNNNPLASNTPTLAGIMMYYKNAPKNPNSKPWDPSFAMAISPAIGLDSVDLYISDVSDNYFFFFQGNALSNGEYYSFDYAVVNGINNNLTFTNDPNQFTHFTTEFNLEPSTSPVYTNLLWVEKSYQSEGYGLMWWVGLEKEITRGSFSEYYFTPKPCPEFIFRNAIEIYVIEPEKSGNVISYLPKTLALSPIFSASIDNNNIEAYTFESSEPVFYIENNGRMKFPLGPAYWSGKFSNTESEVRIEGITEKNILYSRQWMEAPREEIVEYELYQYELEGGENLISQGALPFGLSFPFGLSVSPGKYTLKVLYNNYYIANRRGKSIATLKFDTQNPTDKNPPYLFKLDITRDGKNTDILTPGGLNQIKFKVVDEEGNLGSVSLFCSTDSGSLKAWYEIPLTNNNEEFIGQIPSFLKSESYVSLLIATSDNLGNKFAYEADPAFYYGTVPPQELFLNWIGSKKVGEGRLLEFQLTAYNPGDTTLVYEATLYDSRFDLNQDRILNSLDLLTLSSHIGEKVDPNNSELVRCDLTNDGVIDVRDLTLLSTNLNKLPQGVAFDKTTGVFNWTPTPEQVGDHKISFSVLDGTIDELKQGIAHIDGQTTFIRIISKSSSIIRPTQPGKPYLLYGTNPNNGDEFTMSWQSSLDKVGEEVPEYWVFRNGPYYIATANTNLYQETGLSEGNYSYIVRAVDKDHFDSEEVSEPSDKITIDKTPPLTPGVPYLSSGTNPNNTGTFTIGWEPSSDIDGSGLKNYQIERKNLDTGVLTQILGLGYLPANSYQENKLIEGRYTYRLRAVDGVDNMSRYSEWSEMIIVDKTPPTITTISDSPDPFRPRWGEVSKISYTLGDNLSTTLDVSVDIYDKYGRLIKTLGPFTQALGVNSVTWNGKNSSGYFVRNATYKYRLKATDSAGNYTYSGYYYVTKK